MKTGPLLSTEVFETGPGRLEIDAAELHVTAGPDKGLRFPLGADSLVIGSAPECELVLHDPTVSSRHAEIVAGRHGYAVRDLGSKNGVLLGQFPVERAPLADRMQLRLGQSTLTVRAFGRRHSIALQRPGRFGGLVAHSVKMRAVVALLEQLAPADATVLIEGETGTGKEVAAQALHEAGARAGRPFVVFDCGSVHRSLVADELFGHEAGAFSGAHEARAGLFEEAERGTLFLDEVGELPLDVQPGLLRLIEARSARRVGASHEVARDVRVVAATNRNLAEEVRAGRFRQDLYFRLAVVRLRLPPLRERPEDLPLLAHAFAAELGATLSPEMLALFAAYDWPGNVRELRNVVARLAVAPDEALELTPRRGARADPTIVDARDALRPLSDARRLVVDEFEKRYLAEALERSGGNVSRAAELAGASRQLITRLCARHGLRGRSS
jgi:DNA-binding NtrC family response regulator